jgi:cobalamin biosynthesis protein CbiG
VQSLLTLDNSNPRTLWIGIGCNSKTERLLIEMAVEHVFSEHQLLQSAIAGIATIDRKGDAIALREFCQARNLFLTTFSAEMLQNVTVPNPSEVVNNGVGTPSVAEAAAILGSLELSRASPYCLKQHVPQSHKEEGRGNLIVPKQIFRAQGLSGAVTIAVARV